jgi:diguanylate cyclase (GGDEF)-like protein
MRAENGGPRGWPGWSSGPLVATIAALALFATGVGSRPDGVAWVVLYDLVLYNAVCLGAAAVCLQAARRNRIEAVAWRAVAVSQLLGVAGNGWYTLVVAAQERPPLPLLADALWLAAYPVLYVALIALMRSRVARFHPSMWLDGLIGALGATAVAVTVLLGPSLALTDGDPVTVAINLAYPVADVLLLALLVAVGAILGLRREPVLWLFGGGLAANLAGDVVYLQLATTGVYVEGGPLDLTWGVGSLLMALAAVRSRAMPTSLPMAPAASRVSSRVLAVPMACNVSSLALLGFGWGGGWPAVAAWCAVGCVLAGLLRTCLTFNEVRNFHEVHEQARTDELTGLPNRRALTERALGVLQTASAARPAALLLLDLDGFKEVNDSLGHHAGDQLLQQIAPLLSGALAEDQIAVRLGGDEFAVLLPEATLPDAMRAAHLIQEVLTKPFMIEGVRVHVGVSIGVATAPVPAATVTDLLRCADMAMYEAKTARAGVRAYVPDPIGTADRLRTMADLREALATDQLLVHLQPQVGLADGRVVGAEALVRWQHPTRGLLSPAELLPAAERAGLMRPLTDTVLELALTAAARWWVATAVPVSVNLSAASVTDLDLSDKVAAALARHGLPPEALTLEVVEDTLMADPERGREVLGRLRALGVRTSIDDYGTGYSSLAYLRRLPADELKLDRTLTHDLDTDPAAVAIVRSTVTLAHELGLSLVAEGVEDLATAALLARLGCDVAQGFALARPMPVEAFLNWLAGVRSSVLSPA